MMFNPSRAPFTFLILAVITIVFMTELSKGLLTNPEVIIPMGAILPHSIGRGEPWRLLTAMFLHGGRVHWAANCFSLLQLGSLYEAMFGSWRFLLVYFATGLIASAVSSTFGNAASVGASGAIFGLLGAFIFSIRRSPYWSQQSWTRSLIRQLVFWGVLWIVVGEMLPFIDNKAHIGGLVSGLVLGLVLPQRAPQNPPPSERVVDVMPQDQ
jgi:rhomboid protease GluP